MNEHLCKAIGEALAKNGGTIETVGEVSTITIDPVNIPYTYYSEGCDDEPQVVKAQDIKGEITTFSVYDAGHELEFDSVECLEKLRELRDGKYTENSYDIYSLITGAKCVIAPAPSSVTFAADHYLEVVLGDGKDHTIRIIFEKDGPLAKALGVKQK